MHGHAWILTTHLVTTVVVFHGKLCIRLKKLIPLTLVSLQKNAKHVWSMSMFLSYVFTIFVVFTACVDFKGGTWCSSVATQSIVGLTPVIYVQNTLDAKFRISPSLILVTTIRTHCEKTVKIAQGSCCLRLPSFMRRLWRV